MNPAYIIKYKYIYKLSVHCCKNNKNASDMKKEVFISVTTCFLSLGSNFTSIYINLSITYNLWLHLKVFQTKSLLWQYNPFDFTENLRDIWKKQNSYEKSFKKHYQHKVESWKWRHLLLSTSNTAIRNNSNVSNRNMKTLLA